MSLFTTVKLPLSWESISQSNNLVAGTIVSLALFLLTNREIYLQLFFPGSAPDKNYKKTHILPPGRIGGCPYIGTFDVLPNFNKWCHEQSKKVTSSSPLTVFKSYFFCKPAAILIGTSSARKILNKEFSTDSEDGGLRQALDVFGNAMQLLGWTSMSLETNKEKYRFVKSLVMKAMTNEAVAQCIPTLEESSRFVIDEMILPTVAKKGSVTIEQYMKYMTLDIAWRQILGLDLKSAEEIQEFHDHVKIFMQATNSTAMFLYAIMPMSLLKLTGGYKARMYLEGKIEEKMKHLEQRGSPDGSTVGAMYFTKDDEDPTKKLTKEQVIDNALVLILAGSETSASTLTNMILLLGYHPDVYQKLREEQYALIQSKGETLTKAVLDDDLPYLEGVVKETMRIITVSGGPLKVTTGTITTGEYQIPKNWFVMPSIYLTHEYDPVTKLDDGSHMDLMEGFKPERWLDEKTCPKEYMPWGMSYRYCAGHILAMAEMKTFLATFCRSVKEFDLIHNNIDLKDIKWKFGPVITPQDGVPIAIHTQ